MLGAGRHFGVALL